jgi:hypothetical protein
VISANQLYLLVHLFQGIPASDIDTAQLIILQYVGSLPGKKNIYFDGWDGFGASPVLNSMANLLSSQKMDCPQELRFDKVLYIDCSEWKSKREMQRAIAEELKLDHGTMSMFDNQDEEDDYNGLDKDSRDVIASIAIEIYQRLKDCTFIMIFLNGSDNEVDVTRLGIPYLTEFNKNIMIWTFKRKWLTIHSRRHEIAEKLRYTHIFLYATLVDGAEKPDFCALVHGEATTIVARHQCMLDMDATMVTECCLFELSLHYNFHNITRLGWAAHSSNYWICDGIIAGNKKMEIANALHGEIRWECDAPLLQRLLEELSPTFSVKKITKPLTVSTRCLVKDRHWISITSKEHGLDGIQDIPAGASAVFLAFEKPGHLQPSERSDHPTTTARQYCPPILPPGIFKYSRSIAVLVLSYCAFSFASPPFLMCNSLRFLGLDKCKHKPSEQYCDTDAEWTFLLSLWVLEIRYTEWDEILSKEKTDLMSNLKELNIEGVWSWQCINQLRKILPHLYRLRITNARIYQAETVDVDDSFTDKGKLQLLDLSGNREMKVVPGSLSKASSLEVLLLDGCLGLEYVGALPPSLNSFSLDGYGVASHWTPSINNLLPPKNLRPASIDERDAKISRICLEGCTCLDNLFLRGLPNLLELDLSGTRIKILDFTTMVTQVACLKRLFLLGCEHLVAIKWDEKSGHVVHPQLELLCIDTRGGETGYSRPSIDHTKRSFKLQIHAILSDARLVRSLWPAIDFYTDVSVLVDVYFNILVTSVSNVYSGEDVEPKATHRVVEQYGDVPATAGDAPMQDFPQPPTRDLDHHVGIAQVNRGLDSELCPGLFRGRKNLANLMTWYADSLHLHDISTGVNMPHELWRNIRQCRVERCPMLDTVFPATYGFEALETIWASDLLMARCIWGKNTMDYCPKSFEALRHLNLHACPRLRFALPVPMWFSSFPRLETLHIADCTDMRHVFLQNEVHPEERIAFPNLKAMHLHNLPSLWQICEAPMLMLAPALMTIKIRGCWSLRRLPSMEGRGVHTEKPTVEIEKDVWDALEWDGVEAGHHPSLFQQPRHSRYYRKKSLRGSVLRYSFPASILCPMLALLCLDAYCWFLFFLSGKRTYLMSKELCCSHEQNQSRPHPPHPTVLRQGVFVKCTELQRTFYKTPLTQHRWMWRMWSGLILLMGAPTLLAHKIRSRLAMSCIA